MKFSIDGRSIGVDHPPYVIAELSANHNGSIDRALETVDAAHRCGVHAIKLQTYTPDTMTIDSDRDEFMIKDGLWDGYKLYDLYQEAQTPFEWQEVIFEHSRKLGLTVFSTPFDESAVELLESLQAPAYKIASFELVDLPLIRHVAQTRKPMILSTGMASEKNIEEAVCTARDSGCSELLLMHCVSSYPTSIESANLRRIQALAKRFGTQCGLSDHTLGTTAAVTSIALGACAIEKHFTLNRSEKGPDSEFSLEPDELKQLCADVRDAWKALGHESVESSNSDQTSKVFRRSLFFVKDLPAGHRVGPQDVRRIRPGHGLAPKFFQDIQGKCLNRDVVKGTPVDWEYLATDEI